jgi:hypothetical protein
MMMHAGGKTDIDSAVAAAAAAVTAAASVVPQIWDTPMDTTF